MKIIITLSLKLSKCRQPDKGKNSTTQKSTISAANSKFLTTPVYVDAREIFLRLIYSTW